MTSAPPMARLKGIRVNVHGATVLRDLNLDVAAGEVVGLVGSNGSGKSTLLAVLATLARPVAGTIELFGAPPEGANRRAAQRRIALIGHACALYDRLSLEENLRLIARLTGRPAGHVDAVLTEVGLARVARRPSIACSQGMRRRAELARVLLTRPDLLLLDEVHAGLDRDAAPLVDRVLTETAARGGAGVLVSHEPDRLAAISDRTVRLRSGRIELAGSR